MVSGKRTRHNTLISAISICCFGLFLLPGYTYHTDKDTSSWHFQMGLPFSPWLEVGRNSTAATTTTDPLTGARQMTGPSFQSNANLKLLSWSWVLLVLPVLLGKIDERRRLRINSAIETPT